MCGWPSGAARIRRRLEIACSRLLSITATSCHAASISVPGAPGPPSPRQMQQVNLRALGPSARRLETVVWSGIELKWTEREDVSGRHAGILPADARPV